MVDIDRTFAGKDFELGLAQFAPVHKAIEAETHAAGARAKAIHAGHRNEGDSFIETFTTDTDGYVVLNDERGLKAAMSIEFGRGAADPNDPNSANDPFPDGTVGEFVLHRATGLHGGGKTVAHFPHSKRKKRRRK